MCRLLVLILECGIHRWSLAVLLSVMEYEISNRNLSWIEYCMTI